MWLIMFTDLDAVFVASREEWRRSEDSSEERSSRLLPHVLEAARHVRGHRQQDHFWSPRQGILFSFLHSYNNLTSFIFVSM